MAPPAVKLVPSHSPSFATRPGSIALAASVCLSAAACLKPAPPPLVTPDIRPEPHLTLLRGPTPHPSETPRLAVVHAAEAFLKGAPLRAGGLDFTPDPIGFVRAAYWKAGLDLFDARVAADTQAGGMAILFRSQAIRGALYKETPRPGDLVFWDANRHGDALYPSQVAIVEREDAAGTTACIGQFAGGPRRVRMNLRHPQSLASDDGTPENDALGGIPAAELFRSFANPWKGQ